MAAIKRTEHSRLVRPLRKGQITIPIEFRRQLGIDEDSVLSMSVEDGELRIRPVRLTETTNRSAWFKELYDYFEPVRREADERGYTDEEINAWIDEAVDAVRRESSTL